MPITQDRMIRLILAGDDFAQAFGAATEKAQELGAKVRVGTLPKAEAWDTISGFLNLYALRDPQESKSTLEVEKSYYRREGQRNVRRKAKKRHVREMAGLPAEERKQPTANPLVALRKLAKPETAAPAAGATPAFNGTTSSAEMEELLRMQRGEGPEENTDPELEDGFGLSAEGDDSEG